MNKEEMAKEYASRKCDSGCGRVNSLSGNVALTNAIQDAHISGWNDRDKLR